MTTYATLKTYAQDNYHDSTDTKALREIARFVNDAFRRICRSHDWSFYLKTGRVNTAVKYSTGTVAINTGDSQLILSGGTWPTDAAGAHIVIDTDTDIEFEVKTRVNGSAVIFKDGQVWLGSNISGETYKLYYYVYNLPSDFRKMFDHESEDFAMWYMSPTDFEYYHLTNDDDSGTPVFYTISGAKEFRVWPYPDSAKAVDFLYYRWPAVLSSDGDSMDWVEDWLDLAFRAIDLEIGIRTGKAVADRMAIFQEAVTEYKAMDNTRQYQRRTARLEVGGQPTISSTQIRRGTIS
jgi:hypothetical protein